VAAISWKSTITNGNWNLASNWTGTTPVRVPTSSDDVTIAHTSGDDLVVTIPTGIIAAAKSLTITGGTVSHHSTLTLAGSATLNVSGAITLSNSLSQITGAGTISATGGILGAGVIEAVGGTLAVTGAFDATGAAGTLMIASGATLSFTGNIGSVLASPGVTFVAATGDLTNTTVAQTNVHLGTITGFQGTSFASSDHINLKAFGASDTITHSGAKVTVTGVGGSQTYTFATAAIANTVQLRDSGGVDTLYICFMAGTMIRTPDGEVAVETLKRGDLVMTTDGVAKPVSWLGKQTVSTVFADPVRSFPIRVKAGALGENVPARDLLLSPDHALLVDGVLIHAGALVNETSVVRETQVPQVFVYYHVELDDHSLILAEGAPAETFVDNVDRLNFDNWAEHEALYPEGKPIVELPYPRAKARRQVPVDIRVALAARAEAMGSVEVAAVA
jgi:hypothetical protein